MIFIYENVDFVNSLKCLIGMSGLILIGDHQYPVSMLTSGQCRIWLWEIISRKDIAIDDFYYVSMI